MLVAKYSCSKRHKFLHAYITRLQVCCSRYKLNCKHREVSSICWSKRDLTCIYFHQVVAVGQFVTFYLRSKFLSLRQVHVIHSKWHHLCTDFWMSVTRLWSSYFYINHLCSSFCEVSAYRLLVYCSHVVMLIYFRSHLSTEFIFYVNFVSSNLVTMQYLSSFR